MSYRNQTYVIFDGDKDMWAYAFMLGWKSRDHIDFNFYNAHELNTITSAASEVTVKRKLKERFASAKQVVLIVGESTRNLYRFVRWELDVALELGLPIVAANLNGKRKLDQDRCPPILRGRNAIHVSFNMAIIKKAMDEFAGDYVNLYASQSDDFHYTDSVYKGLGL